MQADCLLANITQSLIASLAMSASYCAFESTYVVVSLSTVRFARAGLVTGETMRIGRGVSQISPHFGTYRYTVIVKAVILIYS